MLGALGGFDSGLTSTLPPGFLDQFNATILSLELYNNSLIGACCLQAVCAARRAYPHTAGELQARYQLRGLPLAWGLLSSRTTLASRARFHQLGLQAPTGTEP